MAEPTDRRTWVTALVALLAAGAAMAGWLLAPDDWPTGPGSAVLARSGETVLDRPVAFGSTDAVSVRGAGNEVAFPAGVPVDAPITAMVTGPELENGETRVEGSCDPSISPRPITCARNTDAVAGERGFSSFVSVVPNAVVGYTF